MSWNATARPGRAQVRVLLTCGHWIRMRNTPWNKQKLGCTAGLGCGYQLNWLEATDEHGRMYVRAINDDGQPYVKRMEST